MAGMVVAPQGSVQDGDHGGAASGPWSRLLCVLAPPPHFRF